MRLVALLLLLFTTSGNVLCLKFDGVWETLWIFLSFALVTQNMHENKQKPYCYSVSNGVRASSFESLSGHPNKLTELHLWKFKLEILQSQFPCRHPNTSHSDGVISDLGLFLCFYFWVKKSKPVGYTRKMYSQTRKITKWAEFFIWCLLLIFKVVYQDNLSATVTSLRLRFCSERAAAGLGPSGLIYMFIS